MALTSPEYRQLATAAIAEMGGTSSPSMVAAVLSQWTCELGAGDAYPPRRNNPGNLARGFAAAIGIPFVVEQPNPQPSNPIVTYRTPGDGARAYGRGIRAFGRYYRAELAAKRGDGLQFIYGILDGHWGTSRSCWLNAYRGLGGAVSPREGGPDDQPVRLPSSTVVADFVARIGRRMTDPIRDADVGPFVVYAADRGVIPRGGSSSPLARAFDGQIRAIVGQPWSAAVPLVAAVSPGIQLTDPVAGAIDAASRAIAQAGVDLVVNVAVLGTIAGLGFLGIRAILTSPTAGGRS